MRLQGLSKLKEEAQAAVLSQKSEDSRLFKRLKWEVLRLDHDIAGTNASLEQCAQNLLTLHASLIYYSGESQGAKPQTARGPLGACVHVDRVHMPASDLNDDSRWQGGAKLQSARGALGARIRVDAVDMPASNSIDDSERKEMRDGGGGLVSQGRIKRNLVAGTSMQDTPILRFRRHSISDLSSTHR